MKNLFLTLVVLTVFSSFSFSQDTTDDSWSSSAGTVSTGEKVLVTTTTGTANFTLERQGGSFFNSVAGTAAGVFFFDESKRFTISPATNVADVSSDFNNALSIYGPTSAFPGQFVIGAQSPGDNSKFTINGTVRCEEAKVVLDIAAPDYVFEPTYELMPLDEVAAYVKTNKHLPEIPSAAEFAANGVKLGEMSFDLLKKVEELTLYLIELKQENEALKARVSELEQK